jgi:hypothetical protein
MKMVHAVGQGNYHHVCNLHRQAQATTTQEKQENVWKGTYMLREENMEAHSSSRSVKATDDVPSNKTGRLDGSSFNRVNKTALSCSCACNIKIIST